VNDDLGMCEEFNSYFTSFFTREDISKLFNVDHEDALLDIYFSQDEVFKTIIKLHCNKAQGVDGLV